ncbi:serine/arginine repetitive matrix protein 1-like [Nilaparvata lugens]|uniref:serine/arginine repetitive matrix protein 1-like n=1 Tax=Nilaparvata lugens TaxID=108931 RepID=UPI000B99BA7A|nr:serine/arginine repetitive matrix protein 1-like [Nilaparvata lugens]
MRKDIKKSSYYVWFLGAQEAKGLRGAEFITPVVRNLVERERDVEPFKVTLQISHKGLKIVQNVPNTGGFSATPKTSAGKKGELVKHFIPHHAVTCVLQDEDIVACILLLYNPVTKCPVHVHAYRCDSVETASVLSTQLQTLTDRPDNQKKLAELEAKGLLQPPPNRTNSTSAESSSGRPVSLYDSVAAELRDKLGSAQPPILLPPRDYDTVHRQKGNLSDIDKRRCLNLNIVGMNAKSTRPNKAAKVGSSGSRGSSGIGSDHAPSPDHEADLARFLDNHSTSDEEWNCDPAKNQSLFLMQSNWKGVEAELSLPRPRMTDAPADHYHPEARSHHLPLVTRSHHSPQDTRSHHVSQDTRGHHVPQDTRSHHVSQDTRTHHVPQDMRTHHASQDTRTHHASQDTRTHHASQDTRTHHPSPQDTRPYHPPQDNRSAVNQETRNHLRLDLEAALSNQRRRRNAEERQRSPSPSLPPDTPRERFNDAKEKFLLLERERLEEQERQVQLLNSERRRQNVEPPISPSVMPVVYQRSKPSSSWSVSRDSEEDHQDGHGRLTKDRYYDDDDDDYDKNMKYLEERDRPSVIRRESMYRKVRSRDSIDSEEYNSRHQQNRLIYPSREDSRRNTCVSPTQRSSDRYSSQDIHRSYNTPSPPLEQTPTSPQPRMAPRHSQRSPNRSDNIPLERYRSPTRMPRPAPRNQRYPSPTESEKKKPVYELMEDERRRSSNELAKEFKRRSYQELDDHERYPGLDRETAAVASANANSNAAARVHNDENTPRYRHSYAEYHGMKHELLHRTNSSVSSGRVGIAAIHPY